MCCRRDFSRECEFLLCLFRFLDVERCLGELDLDTDLDWDLVGDLRCVLLPLVGERERERECDLLRDRERFSFSLV